MRTRLLSAVLACAAGWVSAALILLAIYPALSPTGAPWERAWLLALHRHAPPVLLLAASELSGLGYPPAVAAWTVACVAVWLVRRVPWKAGFLLAATASLAVLDYGGKPLFHRPRPEPFPRPSVGGASYPSGHALFAVGYYGMIAYLALADARGGLRPAGWLLWLAFATALGVSRLVLGVHWPTDVAAGWAAGTAVLVTHAWAARRWKQAARDGMAAGSVARRPHRHAPVRAGSR
jgi:membrane-associated phospholipid phosphatase